MQVFADLHIHSSFAQGSSQELQLEQIALWARRKGLHVVGTGDWTHPGRWSELRAKLMPAEDGLFRLRGDLEQSIAKQLPAALAASPLRFLLSTEVSTVYEQDHNVRKVHHLLFAPDFARAQRIRQHLEHYGDLSLDGRPTLSLSSRDLLETILEVSPRCHLIPAHVWSPWNGLFGATYGFDSLEECYQELSSHIFAIETGLSSVPAMSRRWSALDRLALVSFSNTHAPAHLGREATIFQTPLHYDAFFTALQQQAGLETIECYPERGRYYLDGHRSCDVRCTPAQSKAHQMRCPVCHKPLTIGVLHRIHQLQDRSPEEVSKQAPVVYQQLLSLPEILAEVLDTGTSTRRLQRHYDDLLEQFGPEFRILREVSISEIQRSQIPLLSEAIQRMRAGQLQITPGYDGEYGKVKIFREDESKATTLSLFSWSNTPDIEEPTSASDAADTPASLDDIAAQTGQQLHLFPTPPPPTEETIATRDEASKPTPQAHVLASTVIQEVLPEQDKQLSLAALFQEPSFDIAHASRVPDGTTDHSVSEDQQRPTEEAPRSITRQQATQKALSTPMEATPELATDKVRRLHLPPPKSPQIASRIPAPKQLLAGLNTEQRAAVIHQGSPILVAAGPGTGKTRTLAHRLAYQLASRRVMPQHAVCLTFTQEAATQLQNYLLSLIGPVARRVFVGTFHRFCLRLLQDYRASCLQNQEPRSVHIPPPLPASLLGAFERLALLEDLAVIQGISDSPRTLRYYLDRISWAKQNLLTPDDVAQEQPQLLNQDFVNLYRSYQEHLKRRQLYDLDDLLFETVWHLRESTELCQQLQLQFRAFFIDEYQELNEAQYRLLRFIVSDFADLCVTGDPDQGVYTFRGANRRYFYQFVRDFSLPDKQAVRMALWRNYRSPETVLEAAHHLISKQHDPQRVQTLATQAGPLFIPLSNFSDEVQEAQGIARQIIDFARQARLPMPEASLPPGTTAAPAPLATICAEEHICRIDRYSDIALFYRSSQQLPALEQALSQTRIPYHLTRSGNMTSHSDMQLLLGFMRCTLHDQSPHLALTLILQYWPGLPKPLHLVFQQFASKQEAQAIPSLLQFIQQTPILPEQHAPLQQLILVLHRLHQVTRKSQTSRALIEGFVGELCQWLPAEKLPSPPRLQDLLARASHTPNPRQLLQHLLLEQAPNIPTPLSDGVFLLPIRASKGHEFPVVIVPGCEDSLLPWQETHTDPDAIAEERRLLYVATTRCQQLLWLTQASSRTLFTHPRTLGPSRFLKELQPYLCLV